MKTLPKRKPVRAWRLPVQKQPSALIRMLGLSKSYNNQIERLQKDMQRHVAQVRANADHQVRLAEVRAFERLAEDIDWRREFMKHAIAQIGRNIGHHVERSLRSEYDLIDDGRRRIAKSALRRAEIDFRAMDTASQKSFVVMRIRIPGAVEQIKMVKP